MEHHEEDDDRVPMGHAAMGKSMMKRSSNGHAISTEPCSRRGDPGRDYVVGISAQMPAAGSTNIILSNAHKHTAGLGFKWMPRGMLVPVRLCRDPRPLGLAILERISLSYVLHPR